MGKEELNTKTPLAPIDRTKDLCCPLLGLFGNEDRAPSPEQVNQHKPSSKSTARRTSSTATTVPPRFLLLAPAALSARPGYRWRWSPMTTRAMRRWATSSRSTSSRPRLRRTGRDRADAGDGQGAVRRSRPGDYRRRLRGGGSAGQGVLASLVRAA